MATRSIPNTTAGERKRIVGGIDLARKRGREIDTYADGTYQVPSRTEEGLSYEVDVDRGVCECPDCRYGGHRCAHIVAAEIKRAKQGGNPPFAPVASVERDPQHEGDRRRFMAASSPDVSEALKQPENVQKLAKGLADWAKSGSAGQRRRA